MNSIGKIVRLKGVLKWISTSTLMKQLSRKWLLRVSWSFVQFGFFLKRTFLVFTTLHSLIRFTFNKLSCMSDIKLHAIISSLVINYSYRYVAYVSSRLWYKRNKMLVIVSPIISSVMCKMQFFSHLIENHLL